MMVYKKWISYLGAYCGEVREKNVGFVRVEVRDDCCRLAIGVKGVCGCDQNGLDVGLYIRQDSGVRRVSVGKIKIRDGSGQFSGQTTTGDLFGSGVSLAQCGGVWLTCEGQETLYLASWEQSGIDLQEFMPGRVMTCELHSDLPIPSLWESLCRYYPRTAPDLVDRGVELLQIRLADIRYLPRRLWHYGNNSFLLHGYYHHKHLILGRARGNDDAYLLGVRGNRTDKERDLAAMFGFRGFLPLQENGQEGYWYTQITL